MTETIRTVFDEGKFFAPRVERFADRRPALDGLVRAFLADGYREALARTGVGPGPDITAGPPTVHYDNFEGDYCCARYVYVRPPRGDHVILAISYVAPAFTAFDQIYIHTSVSGFHRQAWDAARLDSWTARPEVSSIIGVATAALRAFEIAYLAWTDARLDQRMPMSDKPDAMVRELLFNFEEYT